VRPLYGVFSALSGSALAQNPVPLINQPLVPDAAVPGGKGFTLTVNGTGFVSASVVKWNGGMLATTFVSSSQLMATVPASDITKASTASVAVVSPVPGGGSSNAVFFPVTIPTSPLSFRHSDLNTGGSGPDSVATGDFNKDGKSDLVVANDLGSNLSVLLGNGNGTFQPEVSYTTDAYPDSLVVADLNGDGNLDIAVRSQYSFTISVLLGNGDGTFQPFTITPTLSCNGRWATGDFNRDGNLDLACTDFTSDNVAILLGKGDGTFDREVDYPAGSGPDAIAVGDFNGDGKLDLGIGDTSGVSILLGNGDGTFQAPVPYATGGQPSDSLEVADLNRDDILDLVVPNRNNTVSVLLGNGDGTFRPHVDYDSGSDQGRSTLADLNGDGKLDLVVTPRDESAVLSVLLGNGDGTFGTSTTYPTGSLPLGVVSGDFNGDGRLDLAVGNNGASTVTILLQDGTITLSPPSLNFGIQVVGTRSAAQKIVLTNISTKTLNISSIAITGTNAGDFSEHENCGSSLPPKAHCAINVTFKPTNFGPRTAAVTVTDNAAGSPQSVPLSGIGAHSGPNATLSTKNLTFATLLVDTASPAQPVTLSNYGSETLDITSIVASGDYSEQDTCGSSLPPAGSCTISVTFTPTQRGHRTGTVSITDNAPHSPQTVHLTGVGTVVKLEPASLNFGMVFVGQKSSPQDTTLTNTGRTALQITGIAMTGTDAGDFSQQNNCPNPGYLGAGKFCTITVTFQPARVGSRSADVSVSDNGGGSPQQVSLLGLGREKFQCGGPCGLACLLNHCGCHRVFNHSYCGVAADSGTPTASEVIWNHKTNDPFTELK
jgi:hypothetical protein